MTAFHRYTLLLVAALLAAALGGCASTQITSAWSDPEAITEVVRVTSKATGEALRTRG